MRPARVHRHQAEVQTPRPPEPTTEVRVLYAGQLGAEGVRRVVAEALGRRHPEQLSLFERRVRARGDIVIPQSLVSRVRLAIGDALQKRGIKDVEVMESRDTLFVQRTADFFDDEDPNVPARDIWGGRRR